MPKSLPTRPADRVRKILTAAVKISAKLKANPEHHRAADYKARLAEYEKSLKVLELYAQAEALEANDGDVTIDVPTGGMSVSGQ